MSQLSNDERNTDNAWIETSVYNYHDDSGEIFGNVCDLTTYCVNFDLPQVHIDETKTNVRWMMAHRYLQLFASHASFVAAIAKFHDAAW